MDHLILGLLNIAAFIFCTYTQYTKSLSTAEFTVNGILAVLNLYFAIGNIAFWLHQ